MSGRAGRTETRSTELSEATDPASNGDSLGFRLFGPRNGQLSADMLDGVVTFRFANPSSAFIRNFQDFYDRFPGQYSDTAYDSVYLIKKSIEFSNQTDAESIRSGLKKIDTTTPT